MHKPLRSQDSPDKQRQPDKQRLHHDQSTRIFIHVLTNEKLFPVSRMTTQYSFICLFRHLRLLGVPGSRVWFPI